MLYDPEQLRTFLAVAQTLSFTQAAQTLGIRQPTVSQHVRKLEQSVGRALFIRDTRSVTAHRRRRGDGRFRPYDPGRARAGRRVLHRLGLAGTPALRRLGRPGADPAAAHPARLPPALSPHRPGADRRAEQQPAPARRVGPPRRRLRQARRRRRPWPARPPRPAGVVGRRGRAARTPIGRCRWSSTRRRASRVRVPSRHSKRAGRTYRITCTVRGVNGVLAAARAGLGVAIFARSLMPDDLVELPASAELPELGEIDLVLLTNPRAATEPAEALTERSSASRAPLVHNVEWCDRP